MILVTALAALIPSVLLVWYFHSRDHRPEPSRAVWACFGMGVLAVLPVLIVDLPLMVLVGRLPGPALAGPTEAFLVAAIPEESFKFLMLYAFARRRRWFDEPMDGIVYGAVVSLGFATFENLLYSLQGGLAVAIPRAFLSVPGHAFWGAIMGYYVGVAHFGPASARRGPLLRALLWPILLHGTYDAPILTLRRFVERDRPSGDALAALLPLVLVSLAIIVISVVAGVRLMRRMRRAQCVALARQGLLPPAVPVPVPVPPAVEALAALWPAPAPATDGDARAPAVSLPPPPSRPLAWVFLVLGALGSTAAGLLLLGVILSVAAGTNPSPGGAVVGGILFGLVPLVLSVVLFRKGLRRLPGPARATLPPAPAPPPLYPPPEGVA